VKKKPIFTGSGVALVTPMKENFDLDLNTLSKLIEFQIENHTDAIISCGTTGESSVLSEEEHEKIISHTVRQVAGRVPVIAGTGSNNTEHALKLSLKAQELGVDALLIVTPYYNKTSQTGLINHYVYIADRVNLPIILYNVPSRTGLNIQPESYKILSEHPNIQGIKEASGNISSLARTIALCKDNINIYSGNDNDTVPVLSLGGIGVISVFANIFPRISHDIVNYFLNNKHEESLKLFLENLELMNCLFCDVNPIPVKTAMKFINLNSGPCRMPLTDLEISKQEYLKSLIIKNFK